jgi:DNA polymerase-1
MNKRLILVDGYSFVFRAFFSMDRGATKGMKRRDGTPTGALYGFTKMLMNLMTSNLKYTHIAVAFDTGGKTFRHEMFSDYKGTRPPCPPDLIPQFPLMREATKALNVKTLEKRGYEADDVIATYAKRAEKDGYEVVIVSVDKDLMQLITDNVVMYDTSKGEFIDADRVRQKWGVNPKQVLDVLSLIGDTSDNVPGVPKIGPKNAADLINQYGDIDNLLANIENIEKKTNRETLQNHRDKAILSRDLIRLNENVPLDDCLDNLIHNRYNDEELRDFLRKNEFSSLMNRLF